MALDQVVKNTDPAAECAELVRFAWSCKALNTLLQALVETLGGYGMNL
jgi:hypothetical protein